MSGTGSVGAFAVALFLGVAGCSPADTAPAEVVVAQDSRYRIVAGSAAPRGDGGELRVKLLPQPGWHIAADAPARLSLEAPAGIRFDTSELRSQDATSVSETGIAFAARYGVVAGTTSAPGPATARGHAKFGVCLEGDDGCEIVRRDLELPLARP